MAINEEALDWCWENTKPVILIGAIDRASEQITDELFIDDAPKFPAEGLRLAGVAEDQRPAILAVIDGYNRVNPRNCCASGCLKSTSVTRADRWGEGGQFQCTNHFY